MITLKCNLKLGGAIIKRESGLISFRSSMNHTSYIAGPQGYISTKNYVWSHIFKILIYNQISQNVEFEALLAMIHEGQSGYSSIND